MEKVMSQYEPGKAKVKGIQGTIEGTVTVIVAGLMLSAARAVMGDSVPLETQHWITATAGTVSGAITLGLFRWWNNRRKHKV